MSLSILRKLRGRSVRELAVRARQLAAALGEQLPWPGVGVPARTPVLRTADGVGGRRSAWARAAPSPTDAEWILARWPAECRQLVERADRAIDGRFDLLGYHDLSFGRPIDWHLDPLTGRRAPLSHWSRIAHLDADRVGDHKVIWELNRHQHFVTFAQAYCLTANPRYARALAEQLAAWLDANPPKLGINWVSSLEVAFRAINWLWALHLTESAAAITPALRARAERALFLHARHLEVYLSTYYSPNTHLTGEALGLAYLGAALEDGAPTRRWRRLGLRILVDELARQVRPDGTYFEQATWYHRYTTDFYSHAALLSHRLGLGAAAELAAALDRLGAHLAHLTRPDGSTPLIGDDDGGRLLPLDWPAPDDFRSSVALVAAIRGHADLKCVAGSAPASLPWLLGRDAIEAYDRLVPVAPAAASIGFPDGGLYVMRGDWSRNASSLVVDGGPHGALSGGHAHADALAVDLTVCGVPFLVDPGTFTYSGVERDAFRATAAHGTLTLDGRSSSEPAGQFRWSTFAPAAVRRWIRTPAVDCFDGYHDGYLRLPVGARHERRILFVRPALWLMLDRVVSAGPHDASLRLQAAPSVSASLVDRHTARLVAPGADGPVELVVVVSGAAGTLHVESGAVSRCYGHRAEAPRLCYDFIAGPCTTVLTVLWPVADRGEPPAVEAVEVGGAAAAWAIRQGAVTAWVVDNPDGHDVSVASVQSRASLIWVMRAREAEDAPLQLFAAGADSATVRGLDVRARPGQGWIGGRWHDGRFTGEE